MFGSPLLAPFAPQAISPAVTSAILIPDGGPERLVVSSCAPTLERERDWTMTSR